MSNVIEGSAAMTQPIEHLATAGPFRLVGAGPATREETHAFWKCCHRFATILILISFSLIGSLYASAIANAAQEAHFFVLRSIGTVSSFATAMLPSL